MADEKPEKDLFLLHDGSTHHVGNKKGDVAQRIITVGPRDRAELIATLLDGGMPRISKTSSRGFTIITGNYKGIPVSIIAIGMGSPRMDLMIREVSYCEEIPLAIIRIGTCGILKADVPVGAILSAGRGSSFVYVNYAHWYGAANSDIVDRSTPKYLITNPIPADPKLSKTLFECLKGQDLRAYDGLNACGQTFYACHALVHPHFDDDNQEIMTEFEKLGVDFGDMETTELFFLAQNRKVPTYAAACCVGIQNRTDDNISPATLRDSSLKAGRAALEALIEFVIL